MNNVEKRFYLFLLLWMLVDMVQAVFTNIHADEAYYALYGQFLDWGYYDHPPMVAILTHLSHWLPGALSIRFCTVLLHGATLWLVWTTVMKVNTTVRDVNEFFIIASSLMMFVLYGFVTTPDAPLLFFTALFFYLYKQYLKKDSVVLALALAVTMAGMMYSKYMAVLVIAFVLLSKLKLLKDWKIWLAGVIALALFAPHIFWQFQHEFPSLKYHFLIRKDPFSWAYPLEFLPNQLLVFNPVCLLLALYFCWIESKSKDEFTRACVFTCVGFILFFWVMTVNGHAEPHWTVAISVPMMFLLYRHTRSVRWQPKIMHLILPFSFLILIIRIALCTPFVPEITGFGDHKPLTQAIHKVSGSTPVVFYTSFQKPSLYRYYTGENGMALSSLYNRQTQYDILQLDKDLQGREVVAISPYPDSNKRQIGNYDFYYHRFEHFQGTNRIEVKVNQQQVVGDSLILDVTFKNNYSVPFDFEHSEMPVLVYAVFPRDGGYKLEKCQFAEIQEIPSFGSQEAQLKFRKHEEGDFVICLSNHYNLSVNSKKIP